MRAKFTAPRLLWALMVLTACTSDPAHAMTPGAEKSAWDPETIPQLTPEQAKALKAAKCRVVSYRNMDTPDYKANTSGTPDAQDSLMLAPGEFAQPGQKDLLALCLYAGGKPAGEQSTEGSVEFFHVVWGGPVQCESTLMMNTVSRYWKSRGSQLDYYGSRLQAMSPTDLRDFLTQMASQPAHGVSEMGENFTWAMEKQKWPEFNHDAFAMSGNYSIAYYCSGKSWVPLFDSYSDEID